MLAQQALGLFAVEFQPVGLAIRRVRSANVWAFVPVEPQPFQVADELIFKTSFAALDIGILDAEHHGAALLPGKEPVEQGRAGIAHVEMPGGRGRKAHTDWKIGAHKMMLTITVSSVSNREVLPRLLETGLCAFHPAISPVPRPACRYSIR